MNPAATSGSAQLGLEIHGLGSALAGPFDLRAAAGEAIVVTGRSGSGKTLLLRMIADLDVNQGTVLLDGQDRRSITAPRWRGLAIYVAAESGWWFDTVAQHFSAEHIGSATELAGDLGLTPEQMAAPVAHLSSGERQRWALIRAAVRQPPILLLDEPTGALDPLSLERVERFLQRMLEQDTILILVTHDSGLAERMGNRRFEMVDRKLRAR
ncbi:MAG TPA: ATP-binding cassette domain-containing protein [Sphingomicrobium sp.]|nr:ATP-binding cassette domain-containing protein [Sphingomicrobium sp.]